MIILNWQFVQSYPDGNGRDISRRQMKVWLLQPNGQKMLIDEPWSLFQYCFEIFSQVEPHEKEAIS